MARRRLLLSVAAALPLAVLAGACGQPAYHYVKSSEDRSYVKVPRAWKLFDEEEFAAALDLPDEGEAQFRELTWSVAFDADPKPSVEHVLQRASHPNGIIQTRILRPDQRDGFSLAALRTLLLDVDPLSDEAALAGVTLVHGEEISRPGGFVGSDLLVRVDPPDGGEPITLRQLALLDSGLRTAYLLAFTCTTDCYRDHAETIDAIAESWTVKER